MMEIQLKTFIEKHILNSSESVSADQELLISGLLDSMSVMRLVSFIKDEFSLSVPAQDITIEHFSSINSICQYLESIQD